MAEGQLTQISNVILGKSLKGFKKVSHMIYLCIFWGVELRINCHEMALPAPLLFY